MYIVRTVERRTGTTLERDWLVCDFFGRIRFAPPLRKWVRLAESPLLGVREGETSTGALQISLNFLLSSLRRLDDFVTGHPATGVEVTMVPAEDRATFAAFLLGFLICTTVDP